MKNAFLWGADLKGTDFWGANLEEAKLQRARLVIANLLEANLEGADLCGANLSGAINLTIEQLSKVKTLYLTALDPEFKKQIKEKYPHLLEKPKEEEKEKD